MAAPKGTVTFVRWSKNTFSSNEYKLKSLDSLTSITILRKSKQNPRAAKATEEVRLQVDDSISLDEMDSFRKDHPDIKVRVVNG